MWQAMVGKGATDLVGGALNAYGQIQGARAAGREIKAGMEKNKTMSQDMRTEQKSLQQPWMEGGTKAFGDLQNFRMREADPYQASQFGGVNMNEDPGVAYRMQQGQQALDNSATMKGSLFSGKQQKELLKYGQNQGSQEFNNAYNRQYGQFKDTETAARDQFNTEANRTMNYDQYRMNQLQGLSNQGQSATNTYGANSMGISQNELANDMTMRGQKADIEARRASAPWVAGGKAVQNTGNAVANYYMTK
jgi:hypothetical protein